MRYYTHIATASIAGITTAGLLDVDITATMAVGLLIGSLAPDIDEPGSYIGRRSLGASYIVNFLFGHRGLTHSLFPVALLVLLAMKFPLPILVGFTAGYLFHILADMFSVSGVPLLLPVSDKKFRIPIYTTGGIREKAIFLVSVLYLLSFFHIFNIATLF